MNRHDSPRILLVEDDVLIAMALEQDLAELGCELMGPVGTMSAAMAAIAHEPPDAAVLDVNLKDHNSFPVAAILASRGIPFLFLTATPDEARSRFPKAPVMAKPCASSQLRTALADLLDPHV